MQRFKFGDEVINDSLHVPSTGLVIGYHEAYGFPVVANDNEIGFPINEFWLLKTGQTDLLKAYQLRDAYFDRFPGVLRLIDEPSSLTGAELKDVGTEKVLNHAATVSPGWPDRARKVILSFRRPFTAEDVQQVMEESPVHHNAWGGSISSAARVGLIKRVGFTPATHPEAHGRSISVWDVR